MGMACAEKMEHVAANADLMVLPASMAQALERAVPVALIRTHCMLHCVVTMVLALMMAFAYATMNGKECLVALRKRAIHAQLAMKIFAVVMGCVMPRSVLVLKVGVAKVALLME